MKTRPKIEQDIIWAAREIYADPSDDDVEVDDNAQVNINETGAWVAAWVWVTDDHYTTDPRFDRLSDEFNGLEPNQEEETDDDD